MKFIGRSTLGILGTAVFAAALYAQPAAAATIHTEYVSPPDADTYLDRSNQNTNYGNSLALIVRADKNAWARTLLRFDLTTFAGSLPSGATITDVSLKLWTTAVPASTRTYNLYVCSDNTWVETDIANNDYGPGWTCSGLEGSTVVASQSTPGSPPNTMSWSSSDLKNAIISAVGAADKRISLFVKDNDDNPSSGSYESSFRSKEGASNTYPTDDFKPVLAITYSVPDTPPVCEYPVQISEFSATPGTIAEGTSSSFDIAMTIHACQDLTYVKAQGGTAGNTTTSDIECDPGTCVSHKPGKSKKDANNNQIIPWLIDGMSAGDDAYLTFTVTTGQNPAGKSICSSDSLGSILKNVTGAWSVTATYDDGGTPAQYTTTHGPKVVDIYCQN